MGGGCARTSRRQAPNRGGRDGAGAGLWAGPWAGPPGGGRICAEPPHASPEGPGLPQRRAGPAAPRCTARSARAAAAAAPAGKCPAALPPKFLRGAAAVRALRDGAARASAEPVPRSLPEVRSSPGSGGVVGAAVRGLARPVMTSPPCPAAGSGAGAGAFPGVPSLGHGSQLPAVPVGCRAPKAAGDGAW